MNSGHSTKHASRTWLSGTCPSTSLCKPCTASCQSASIHLGRWVVGKAGKRASSLPTQAKVLANKGRVVSHSPGTCAGTPSKPGSSTAPCRSGYRVSTPSRTCSPPPALACLAPTGLPLGPAARPSCSAMSCIRPSQLLISTLCRSASPSPLLALEGGVGCTNGMEGRSLFGVLPLGLLEWARCTRFLSPCVPASTSWNLSPLASTPSSM